MPIPSVDTRRDEMSQKLDGKVAIVTGAAQGIGEAAATALAAAGAKVLIADINIEGAKVAADKITAAGGEAAALGVDVSEEDDVREMISTAVDRWGRLDVLMNNAHSGQPDDTDVVSTTRETWDLVFACTLFGVVYGCKYGVPAMIQNGGGSIINVSSNAALGGDFTRVAYAAAKNALVSVSKYTATAFGKQGIRCNVVSPGVLVTPPVLELFPAELRDVLLSYVMAPRLGTPDDAAGLVTYLASDEAIFINGQDISVDGAMGTAMGAAIAVHKILSPS
jgi:NAD(P)-dependent dehydrogenase (short-subunit alcohol dehydrogenase family)